MGKFVEEELDISMSVGYNKTQVGTAEHFLYVNMAGQGDVGTPQIF